MDVGIAEQHSSAPPPAGASRGVPVVRTATFLTMRAFEFIRTDVASRASVKLVGALAGFCRRHGPTIRRLKDLASCAEDPGMKVCCPARRARADRRSRHRRRRSP